MKQEILFLGSHIEVLLFNSGYLGMLPVFKRLKVSIDTLQLENDMLIGKEQNQNSRRQSVPATKLSRKKAKRKSKLVMK